MNKKFFAALASATMAFTASGSIAVFADDFVEERNDVITGDDVKPAVKEVVWNADNFGAFAKEAGEVFKDKDDKALTNSEGKALKKGDKVKTTDLAKVEKIELSATFEGEVKGLEYFTGLKSFDDSNVNSTKNVTNATLDFSASTKLETLTVKKAEGLATLVLPEASKNEDDEDVYSLTTLDLEKTALTALDLTAQTSLEDVTVKNNANLKDVKLLHGTKAHPTAYGNVDLSANSIETIDLANCAFHSLDLSGNHIGVIDFSQTTLGSKATLTGQTLYVSETLATVNLKDTFGDVDTHDFSADAGYNKKTGELDLEKAQAYSYVSKAKKGGVQKLEVTLTPANPMNRLYNPNSGEHFYTADIKEKAALVSLGWNDEGYGWVAPKANQSGDKAVYRLYNPNAGDHHYTTNKVEKDTLVTYGWKDEGKGWYSDDDTRGVKVYRQYNPFANGAGSHNYTVDKAENDHLVSLGWTPEGTAWYGLK